MDKKRIALLGSLTWDGGIDFVSYIAEALVFEEPSTEIFLILPYDTISILKSFILKKLPAIIRHPGMLLKDKLFEDNPNLKIINSLRHLNINFKVIYYNYSKKHLARRLREVNADVLFPVVKSLGNFPIPAIGYIPDLQHKYFPHFFSEKERRTRDVLFENILKQSKAVIVNSRTVKTDLQKFYAVNGNTIFALPFTPPSPKNFKELKTKNEMLDKFDLNPVYLIISNQFWKHKAHDVAFKAFALLQKQSKYKHVSLACTGKMNDPRFPEYIEQLQNLLETGKLKGSLKLLGFTSKIDQLSLLRHSVALIQPTLFEGGPGGGSVYNAISYGTKCIVSDIEINKEIQTGDITFFKSGSVEDLAQKMQKVLDEPREEKPDFEALNTEGQVRTRKLKNALFSIFNTL